MMTQVSDRDAKAIEPAIATMPGDFTRGSTAPETLTRGSVDLPRRTVDALTRTFAALGEPTRLRIVHVLAHGERSVGDLADVLNVAVPAMSQHLRVLRELRIVRNRRAGKTIYYALDDAHVAELFAVALAHVQGGEG